MARPAKQKAEYFPHFVGSGKTIRALERRYGNDGYAFWFKLLETVCDTEGHCLDLSDPINMIDFSGYVRMEEDQVSDIVEFLIILGKIDKELWVHGKRVWIQGLVDNLAPLYAKRANPIRKPSDNGVSVAETPQRRVEESIGEKRREEEPNGSCAEQENSSSTPPDEIPFSDLPPEPKIVEAAVISLPCTGGKKHGVAQSDIDRYAELYPAVDVRQQLRNMVGWLEANPKRLKTAGKGAKAFITGWLVREQNRGGVMRTGIGPPGGKPPTLGNRLFDNYLDGG